MSTLPISGRLPSDNEINFVWNQRIVDRLKLEGIAEGYLIQPLVQSRANFKVRSCCPVSCLAKL